MLKSLFCSALLITFVASLTACKANVDNSSKAKCPMCSCDLKDVAGYKEAPSVVQSMFMGSASRLTPDKRPSIVAYGTIFGIELKDGWQGSGIEHWLMYAENQEPTHYVVRLFNTEIHKVQYKPTKVAVNPKKSIIDLMKQAGLPMNDKQHLQVNWVNRAFFSQ